MQSPAKVTLRLDSLTRSRHQISVCYWLNDLRFTTSYWYDTVDFHFLENHYGEAAMRRIYFHILAFEAMKIACLKPDVFDLGDFADCYTTKFDALWREIFDKSYRQWRYENNLPFYKGPAIVPQKSPLTGEKQTPIRLIEGDTDVLVCSGGGKDSLVMYKLLERAGIPFSSYSHASTVYGQVAKQFSLIENLLKHANPVRVHRNYGFGDYVDTPVAQLYPEYGLEKMPELDFFCPPPSLFALLPIILQYGYKHIVVGYERSADESNLIWEETGQEINHQWFKSTESDRLLRSYINEELISGLGYFSLLRPIYDVTIFGLLQKDSHALKDTHSCNIGKPWCERCAKCAYVYLACMAYLPEKSVRETFPNNLFDLPENQIWYRELLGLEKHKAFECVGEIEEVRLAFEICKRKGIKGKAIEMFAREVTWLDYKASAEKYTNVNCSNPEIPEWIAKEILPQMESAAISSQQLIFSFLD